MIYRFGCFELDLEKIELRRGGAVRPVEPQVFALLGLLIEHRERVVSKDEIVEKVWEGRAVSDAAIASRVKSARQALGDDGRAQRFIKTVHGHGFRFVADARATRGATAEVAAEVAAGAEATATDRPPADRAGRPSIAVLPFHLAGAPGPYATIADALPHELIAELSRLRWLFVTARGSSFRLRAAEVDVCEVGRLLGVRYCLSGTVEIEGTRLQVTVALADTGDGGVVWADRFAAVVDDVHQIRGEIRSRILAELEIRIPLHEAARARLTVTENLDAWAAYHLGLQHTYRFTRRDNAVAESLFARAVALAPDFARAHAGLSFTHFQTAFLRYSDDRSGAVAQARRFAERGLDLDPMDPFVNFTLGRSYWLEGDLDGSLGWLERAVSISPNYAQGIYACAWSESLAGRGEAGRSHVDLAMRLSPLDPLYYAMLATRGFAHMALGEDAEAAQWSDRGARAPGAHPLIAMIAAAAQALGGDAARAAFWAANARARNASLTAADFFRAFPMQSDAMRGRVAKALAGLGF